MTLRKSAKKLKKMLALKELTLRKYSELYGNPTDDLSDVPIFYCALVDLAGPRVPIDDGLKQIVMEDLKAIAEDCYAVNGNGHKLDAFGDYGIHEGRAYLKAAHSGFPVRFCGLLLKGDGKI